MKIVVNRCFGGFEFSEAFEKAYPEFADFNEDSRLWRTNEKLISALEAFGLKSASGYCADLEIVTIPDYATDWIIDDYDGMETLYYVLHGKIKTI